MREEMQGARGDAVPPLVSGAWLAAHLDHPDVRVLDTRGRVPAPGTAPVSMRSAYEEGHVPGAAFVTWNSDFVDVADPVPNQLAGPERFSASAAALGIDAGTHVVAYDDYHSIFASRLWWAFRAMGHPRVSVLDGGLTAWHADEHPLEQGPPAPRSVRSGAEPLLARAHDSLRWSLEQVKRRDADVVLVDARSRERYAGTGSDPVGGHVPGAVNVPYTELVGDDGLLRPAEHLRAAFLAAGIDPDAPPERIVACCGSGISATVPLLALEVLCPGSGVRGAVYDGSWGEWSRSGEPIATGAEPG